MARTISVSDDVYEWMSREKGDRSFSELIRSLKEEKSDFKAVNGVNAANWETVEKALAAASEKSWEKFEDR